MLLAACCPQRCKIKWGNIARLRYALCVVIFLTRWIRHGEAKEIRQERLVNHVMDLKTAAVATFFDGLKTHDEMPKDVHLEAKYVLSAIGAYTNCGKGGWR